LYTIILGILLIPLCVERSTATSAFRLYTTAAVLIPSIIPYTILFLNSYNTKLLAKADSLASTSLEDTAVEAGVAKEETVHSLVDAWATLNLGRALITATAAVAAAWAALIPDEI
jgi:hypothetical protein